MVESAAGMAGLERVRILGDPVNLLENVLQSDEMDDNLVAIVLWILGESNSESLQLWSPGKGAPLLRNDDRTRQCKLRLNCYRTVRTEGNTMMKEKNTRLQLSARL